VRFVSENIDQAPVGGRRPPQYPHLYSNLYWGDEGNVIGEF
jgi:hypothetical protein